AAPHELSVHVRILAQRRPARDGPAVELEHAVGREAVGPAIGILRVDRVAIAGTKLLDGELLGPLLIHGSSPAQWRRWSQHLARWSIQPGSHRHHNGRDHTLEPARTS